MAGENIGGKDNYWANLTEEERAEHLKRMKAGREAKSEKTRARKKAISTIAKLINGAPAGPDLCAALEGLGIPGGPDDWSNAYGITLGIYQAAINGDMKAVDRWISLIGEEPKKEKSSVAEVAVKIVEDIPRPSPEDLEATRKAKAEREAAALALIAAGGVTEDAE